MAAIEFQLDEPLPDGVLVEGAIVMIRGIEEDGALTWFVRESGNPGNAWERLGFLRTMVSVLHNEAVSAWIEED